MQPSEEKPVQVVKGSKPKRKGIIFRIAGIIAIIAGLVMVGSGYTSHPIYLFVLEYVKTHYGSSLPSTAQLAINLAIFALNIIVALGGVLVISGGVLLLLKRGFSGRLLIRLGGGLGIFGLLIAIGETYYLSGFSLAAFHAEYWIGIILAVAAIWLSQRA